MNLETYTGYVSRVECSGIKFIDCGSFATVFQHPVHRDVVVKVVKNDPAYLKYLEFVLANQGNPWVPKVHEFVPVKFTGAPNACLVFMEHLESLPVLNHSNENHSILNALDEELLSFASRRDARNARHVQDQYSVRPMFQKEFWKCLSVDCKDPELREVMSFLNESEYDLDLHVNNIMFRKSTNRLVLTDPVYLF